MSSLAAALTAGGLVSLLAAVDFMTAHSHRRSYCEPSRSTDVDTTETDRKGTP